MFTLEQIKAAHSKVKSGADFPAYVQEMKALGVTSYEHFVSDGHTEYHGGDGFGIKAAPKWDAMDVADESSVDKLKHALAIHQQGQTDYMTFCRQSAEAGVEKWIVDMEKMQCIYYDKAGNEMVAETIPAL